MKSHPPLFYNGEEIIIIEYSGKWPCIVITREKKEYQGKPYTSHADYDFSYCRREKMLYWHETGGGGSEPQFHVAKIIKGVHEFWTAPGIKLMKAVKRKDPKAEDGYAWKDVACKEGELAERGYKRILQPRLLSTSWGDKSRNPFDVASGDMPTIWCSTCDDDLPDESDVLACGHLEYCDDCSAWIVRKTGLASEWPNEKCEHLEGEEQSL